MKSVPVWGVLSVIGGFLYHLALGYFYTVGNMNPYVQSYMGITEGQTTWFSSTILAFQAVSMPFGGIIASKISYRWVLLIGIITSAGGVMLTSLTVNHGLGAYIATYCVCFGIGMGLPYSVILSVASTWFPNNRATVVGFISAGFGLGALVFTPIQKEIIAPDPNRIPSAFLILGGIVLGLEIIGTILLRQKTEKKATIADEITDKGDMTIEQLSGDAPDDEEVVKLDSGPRNYTVKEAFKSIDFYILWFIVFLGIVPVVLLTSTYKLFGFHLGYKDDFLTPIATTTAAFNCLGRMFWGFMVDKFSSKCPTISFLVIWSVIFFTFPYAGRAGQALYAIWAFILYFALAALFVVMPATCTRIFGPANMATLYGIIYFATCPSALLTAAVVSAVLSNIPWIEIYSACGAFCLAALILSLFIRDNDVKCVGFTNKICAAACDPCRKLAVPEAPDVDLDDLRISDASSAAWAK